MKLNMHNVIAGAILCTALLVSFCNAYPYRVYWDREAFLEQLQQKEHLGTDVAARIEQDSRGELQSCPDFLHVLNPANTKDIRESRDIHNGIIISANFTYACASPFILFVSHDGKLTYQRSQIPSILYECRENSGTYQPSIDEKGFPRCFSLCPELSISNGDVEYDADRPREPHTEATYSCREGYTLEGERTRICGQEGKWLGEDPECIVVMCPELSNIPNGTVTVTNRRPGGIANYSCLKDYYLSGEQTRTCRQDGKWSCKEPTCFPLCPILSLRFGHIMYIFGDRKHGDIAAYSCRSGYRLVGPKERTCRQDGKWSKEEPRCQAITCPLVDPILNGDTTPDRSPIPLPDGSSGFPLDTVVTYTCRPNFELRGESTRTCLESGEWDPQQEPFCAPELKCPELTLSDIPNNYPEVVRDLEPYTKIYGNSVLYKKFFERRIEGDRIEGSKAYLTCLKSNGWQLLEGTPDVQICERNATGALNWTQAGTCVFPFTVVEPKCPELKLSDIPKNVPEVDRQLKRHWNYQQLRYKPYYNRRIEGDRSEGSKAYLTCVNGWTLESGTPAVQICVRENGALVWTEAGICDYCKSV